LTIPIAPAAPPAAASAAQARIDDGDPEEPGDAGDGAVDRRRDDLPVEPGEEQDFCGGDQRPTAHEEARAEAVGESPEAAGLREHRERYRQRRRPAFQGAVARDLLQVDGEVKKRIASPAYTQRVSRLPAAKFRCEKSSSSSTGSGARRS
jgi:hypothetical protein